MQKNQEVLGSSPAVTTKWTYFTLEAVLIPAIWSFNLVLKLDVCNLFLNIWVECLETSLGCWFSCQVRIHYKHKTKQRLFTIYKTFPENPVGK